MYFIREAFRRKPLEKSSLVWFRGITAVGLTCIFIAYFIYLSIQVYQDQPLIKLLAENITDSSPSPDVEMCSAGANMRIWYCDIWKMDWSVERRENCTGLVKNGAYSPTMFCMIFQSNGSIAFGVNPASNPSLVQRVDFYWQIDNLTASVSQTLAIPAIGLQLYSPNFNPWYTGDMAKWIPRQFQAYRDITMGVTKATSMQRYTTMIFFTPSTYMAIRPFDFGSLFGMIASYVAIPTIKTESIMWPLHFNSNFSNGMMTGEFSIQLGSGTMNIEQEQRQHTLLSLLALTGGAFGLLNILYVLLFGMTRLAPWGLVHRLPFFFEPAKKRVYTESDTSHLINKEGSSLKSDFYDIQLERVTTGDDGRRWGEKTESEQHPLPHPPDKDSTVGDDKSIASDRQTDLELRVQELENILANYFLDTKHLDRMRRKSSRQPQLRKSFTTSLDNA